MDYCLRPEPRIDITMLDRSTGIAIADVTVDEGIPPYRWKLLFGADGHHVLFEDLGAKNYLVPHGRIERGPCPYSEQELLDLIYAQWRWRVTDL